jgi:hypothetical protein
MKFYYWKSRGLSPKSLENQFIYPIPNGSKLIFFAPLGAGVNEEPRTLVRALQSQNQ